MLIKIISYTAMVLLLPGCSAACGTSLAPVGTGLTSIAICMVASSVVRSLTTLVTRKMAKPPEVPFNESVGSRNPQHGEEQP